MVVGLEVGLGGGDEGFDAVELGVDVEVFGYEGRVYEEVADFADEDVAAVEGDFLGDF